MNLENQSPVGFSQLISERFPQLTKSEKVIANYLNQNQDEAAFLSAGEIADRLQLSEATMVRFARTLGFDSYPTMRVALQDSFRHRLTHSARLRSRLDDLRADGDIFERLVASEIDYLTEALQTLDRKALNAAVELLRTHQRVFVFGLGPSLSLVDLLDIRLTRSARYVIPLNTSGREMLEPMLLMDSNDLLIAIGFFNLTPNLQMVLDYANQHKTPVILLTDTLGPMLGDKADVVLSARRGPVSAFHSLTVPMTIVNALLLALSSVDQEKVMTNLDKLDQLREHLKKTNGSLNR
ncbi:MAG: MurR/RpiR family transcriptional regulator [Candidatus Atribacteria bacterium]|nr:MurR/RpiR family transcriptional regulator [Candidatus Atribacteria bacterium]